MTDLCYFKALIIFLLDILHIVQGSARQLFQRLQGPVEEDTLKEHFNKIIQIAHRRIQVLRLRFLHFNKIMALFRKNYKLYLLLMQRLCSYYAHKITIYYLPKR